MTYTHVYTENNRNCSNRKRSYIFRSRNDAEAVRYNCDALEPQYHSILSSEKGYVY